MNIRNKILLILLLSVQCYGSLNLTADSTDRIAISNTANIQDQNAWTMIWWWRWATSFNDFSRLMGKGTASGNKIEVGFSGSLANGLDIQQNTDGTDLSIRIGGLSIDSDATWQYLAITVNIANGAGAVINIYYGNLTTSVVLDVTDGTASGNSNEGSSTLYVGCNYLAQTFGLGGDIAMFQYWNKEMTLAEIRAQQFRPHPDTNCQIFHWYGFNGDTGVNADFSGNGNSGTGTGTTVADHVPLGPPFGAMIPLFLITTLIFIRIKNGYKTV